MNMVDEATSTTLARLGVSSPGSEEGKERSPLAAGISEHEALDSEGENRPDRWNTSFRFALKSRASLSGRIPTKQQHTKTSNTQDEQQKRGHF
jgi:hypothetical protein